MGMQFRKAEKSQSKLRLALIGPSGSGKTYTALAVARGLGSKVAVIDTEHGSAALYADQFGFDVLCLESFAPTSYVEAIAAAESAGYDVIVIDSLSHAWSGKDGALEMVDRAAARSKSGNSYTAWRDVTPEHNRLVDSIVRSKIHIIATMRSKTEYVQERDDKGKTIIRKVGMQPIQRDGMEYEFTVTADLDHEHNLIIGKTRMAALDGVVIKKAGEKFGADLLAWLNSGAAADQAPKTPAAPKDDLDMTPPPSAGKQQTAPVDEETAKFLSVMEPLIAKVGPAAWQAMLGMHGIKDISEATDRKTRKLLYGEAKKYVEETTNGGQQ